MTTGNEEDSSYHLHEGSLPLSIPGEWEDQSVNVLRLRGNEFGVTSLIISRDTLPPGQSIADFTEQELFRMAKHLKDFALKAQIPVEWADAPGTALLTRWRSDDIGLLDQITACRLAYGQTLLTFTATHLSPMPDGLYKIIMAAISGFCPRNLPGTPPALSLVKG